MKFNNLKLNGALKLATYISIGSITAASLTGCSAKNNNNDNILKGTILENTNVITLEDGSKDIAVAVDYCSTIDQCTHYYSIISGEYFSDVECEIKEYRISTFEHVIVKHYIITNEESIAKYLSADEIKKGINGELSNEDISTIITRITNQDTEIKNIIK